MKERTKEIISFFADLLIIIGVSLLLTQYVVSSGQVSGRSMEPTLVQDQKLLIDKVSVHFNAPKRFDIITVKFPGEKDYWVKRVIGLPGDLVEIRDGGELYINNEYVEQPFLPASTITDNFSSSILVPGTQGVIPNNQYLVMGDNRGNSLDGRIKGLIDKKDILGVARVSYYPFDRLAWL